jgi:hypothetical protein
MKIKIHRKIFVIDSNGRMIARNVVNHYPERKNKCVYELTDNTLVEIRTNIVPPLFNP